MKQSADFPSVVGYEPISFGEVAGWPDGVTGEALVAYLASARLLARHGGTTPPPPPGDHGSLAARSYFESHFRPHRLLHDGPPGLVTGYFEPEFEGSRVRTRHFTVPLRRRPPDLVNVVPESNRAAASTGLSHVRMTAGGPSPYFTRREIESGALDSMGLEFVWLADPVEAFVLHVQGSGRVMLPNGETVRLAYDGKNGHPYTSIGRALIDDGVLAAEGLTLDKLTTWLRLQPDAGRDVMWRNHSYVFFRELGPDEPSPIGAESLPLVPGVSLAVDTAFHALGTPIFVDAPGLSLDGRSFTRLMVAQDVGSAIRGPERGDIFFGTGADAGRIAGAAKHGASFVVLLPEPTP